MFGCDSFINFMKDLIYDIVIINTLFGVVVR